MEKILRREKAASGNKGPSDARAGHLGLLLPAGCSTK